MKDEINCVVKGAWIMQRLNREVRMEILFLFVIRVDPSNFEKFDLKQRFI